MAASALPACVRASLSVLSLLVPEVAHYTALIRTAYSMEQTGGETAAAQRNAVQRLGRLTFVDVDQHESCPICLEDGPAKHVKLNCNHTVCAACFSCAVLLERSPQPSPQEFGCPPYPQGTGPEDQDPTTGAYIWDGIEEAWRASNSSEAEAFENAVRCTYTVPNGSYPVLRMTLDALQLDALEEKDQRRARKREQTLSKCPLCREPTPMPEPRGRR